MHTGIPFEKDLKDKRGERIHKHEKQTEKAIKPLQGSGIRKT